MRLEWLKDVLTVAETGSFTEAAQRRHLTQSAFSRRIQMIEDYVGVELFDRSRKPVQLRPTTQAQGVEPGIRKVLFALAREFGIPIRFVGVGESLDDLRVFDARAFVDGLLPERIG